MWWPPGTWSRLNCFQTHLQHCRRSDSGPRRSFSRNSSSFLYPRDLNTIKFKLNQPWNKGSFAYLISMQDSVEAWSCICPWEEAETKSYQACKHSGLDGLCRVWWSQGCWRVPTLTIQYSFIWANPNVVKPWAAYLQMIELFPLLTIIWRSGKTVHDPLLESV